MVRLSFTAEYAGLLFLLNGMIILVFLYSRRKRKERVIQFGNFETLKKVSGDKILEASDVILILRVIAVSCLMIGLSSPIIISEAEGAGFDFVLVLDTSASMFTDDIEPNRFQAAKNSVKEFISQLGSTSEIGFITYAGGVTKQQELTSNKRLVESSVDQARIGSKGGTATGDAISSGITMLTGNDKPGKVILVTDGRRTVGQPINESADFAKRQNITVDIIGIGDTTGDNPDFGSINGRNASRMDFPNLNKDVLRDLASKTGGKTVFVSNSKALEQALIKIEERTKRDDVSNLFFIIAGVLLVIESIIRTTDIRVVP